MSEHFKALMGQLEARHLGGAIVSQIAMLQISAMTEVIAKQRGRKVPTFS